MIPALQKSKRYREFNEVDAGRVRRVKVYLFAFVAAQVLCTVGELVVVFFPRQIASTGPLFIWVGVYYPGNLLSFAFFFILLILRRNKVDWNEKEEKRKLSRGSSKSSGDLSGNSNGVEL